MAPDASKDNTTSENTINQGTESVDVSLDSERDIDRAISQAREETETLRGTTIDTTLQSTATRSDIAIARAEFMRNLELGSLDWYLSACNELLTQIDEAIKAIKKTRWLSQAWKKTMENTKSKLQSYKKTIKGKMNALMKQTNPEIYASDIQKLREYRRNFESAKQDIAQWQWWELSNWAPSLYNSTENARKSNAQQERMLQFEQRLEQEVKHWAILNIFEWQKHNAINFYRRIAEWQYTSADYTTYITHSDVLNPSFQRCWLSIPTEQWIISPATGARTGRCVDYTNTSFSDTFKQWGVAWIIDKALSHCNNLTPWQRNTRKSLWVLAAYWAWIYGLFKFFTNKKMSFRQKAWITAGAFFGTEVLLWESPISLFNKFMSGWLSRDKVKNSFWNAVSWVWGSGVESSETLAPAMYSLMVFNSWTTVWNINTMTQSFKSDNNARKAFYDKSINTLQHQYGWTKSTEYFRATFSENFDEQKRNNWLASIWITDISNPSNSGKLVYELANNAAMNEIAIEKFKSENWVKETSDKNKKQEFKQYVNWLKTNNQAIDITVLQWHLDDWFETDHRATYTERPEDQQNIKWLEWQVDHLSLDATKKDELKRAVKKFYNERSIDTKPRLSDFQLKIDNEGRLILKSHNWEEAKIDIAKWELIWFWSWIGFSDLSELLNAADLSNKILDSQKWAIPKQLPAFQYKSMRRWICFNNANDVWEDIITRNNTWKDIRVLSSWRWWVTNWLIAWAEKLLWLWGATSKIENLYKYPNEFASYLSDRRLEKNKIEIDANLYPNVKKLSNTWTWITFTNENEVKELESWLNEIKEQKKFSVWTPTWNPFKISWKFKDFGNRLVFVAVNGDKEVFNEDISNKFPTIMANQNEFLKYMNNKDNWMWWSVFN